MKLQRFVTALLLFPFVVALLIFGNNHAINIAFSIVAIVAMGEFFNAFKGIANPVRWIRICHCCVISFFRFSSG